MNELQAAAEQPQPEVQPVRGWQPIATAPRDSKRPLYLAKFDGKGEMQAIDFDGGWEFWRESWEMPHINGWDWTSASGIEDPTHWAYQDEGAPPATPLPEAQPVAVVTECEACFTPDVCQLRGKCDHYSTEWLRVAAPPPAAPTPEPSDAVAEFARGIDAAARLVEQRRADYDAEHGSTDPDTGAREYPGTGDEYVCDLDEIAEAIRGLAPPPSAPEPSEAEVEAACAVYDALGPTTDRGLMADALRAAAAARGR